MTTPSDRPGPPPLPAGSGNGKPASGWMEAGAGWRRQHPAAFFFNTLQTVRVMLFPIIAAVVTARGLFLATFLGLILFGSISAALLRYWRYRYRFTEHELVVEQGWLYRQVRHISYSRIQNINITRNVLHRIFGVSGMQLESASGSEPEAVMHALSQAAIGELHERIDAAKSNLVQQEEEERTEESEKVVSVREPRRQILRLGLGELIRHGLISNRGMILVAAAIGYLFQGPLGDYLFPMFVRRMANYTDRSPVEMGDALGPFSFFLLGLGVFLVVIVVLALLSVFYAIIRYYGFSLSVDSKSLRAEFGLFTRVAITIPRGRIQLIGFRANPFHRLFRRLSIKVETAGITGSEESPSSLRWLAPILPEGEVQRLLKEVQPESSEEFEWRRLHRRTRVRLLRIRLVLLGVVTVLLAFITGIKGLLALLLIPLVLAYASGYFRYAGWAITPAAIAFRSGWLVKQQSIVRFQKIQVVSLSRNPFDRRWGMATVNIDTAGSDPRGHRVQVRFMDYESARELRNFLEEKTRETGFVWG